MPLTQLDGPTSNRTNETCDVGLGDTFKWGGSGSIFIFKQTKKQTKKNGGKNGGLVINFTYF